MRKFLTQALFFALCLCLPQWFIAQNPNPAPAQSGSVLIWGATAHLGNGQVINNSAIAFEKGKLTLVADATLVRIDRSKYNTVYDAAGKHVYPGFIAPVTNLGLSEIEAARATNDYADIGTYNPNLRALVAYNTDSDVIPTVRSNGVLLAQIAPQGGTISGTSSVVQLDAWNWEDAAYQADGGIHLNWPPLRSFSGWGSDNPGMRKNEQYEKDVAALRRFFEEAQAYSKQAAPEVKNQLFESMRPLFAGKATLFIHVDNARAIQESVLFAENFGLTKTVVGASEAWLVADFLKLHNVPVVLGRTQSLPSREDEAVDQAFTNAVKLHEKGVLFAFSIGGFWQQRNLPFQAGQAVGFGLPKEAALSALTLNTAKILGVDSRCGSLETGKDATLFISEGDALDMRGCKVTAAFIQGRNINLDNKHKQLYQRFEQKYRQ
jgi:imidazolonepropionase-like amidohydrolase